MAVYIKEGVAVIGAGPAGLAMSGRLHQAKIPYTIFDREADVASSWRKHYDRLCLHTVRNLSHLPFLPFPDHYPTYVPRNDLVAYYESYIRKFDIQAHYKHELSQVTKAEQGWKLQFKNGDEYIFKKVVFATGVNREVIEPHWPDEDKFKGTILHSRHYKNPQPYKDKKVLVVGMGNTGAEIALDLTEHNVATSISVRDQVLIVPRDIFGNPSQVTANRLAKLPLGIGDWLGNTIRKLIIGNVSRYGLESNPIAPVKHLRETGRTPVMDLGTIKNIKAGKIKVVPEVVSFTESGVILKNQQSLEVDIVILATGYSAGITKFIDIPEEFLDENMLPKSCLGTGQLNGVYFLGFDNYQLGGILGAIYRDSETILDDLDQKFRS